MENFEILGGKKLSGKIEVNGAKNSALKILSALTLSQEICKVTNFPFIEDTRRMLEILADLGVNISADEKGKSVSIEPRNIKKAELNEALVKKLRSSITISGPLLSRFGKVKMPYPGGCVIGKRPIDIFLSGFRSFGVKISWTNSGFILEAKGGILKGADIFFPKVTVTGTETMMMTAVLARGKTVLKNCAMEPEISVLAHYLNSCGAKISGAGTSTIEIEGVRELGGGEFRVIPDRIEAGTFVMMGLLTGSEITVKNCVPEHLGAVIPILKSAGAKLEIGKDYIKTKKSRMKAVSISTHEYPGFATDLQSPYTLLMTQAEGTSIIHETIFEGRLFFTDQLNTMGANIIMCDPHRVVVTGPTKLYGKRVNSPDLRAGITMILAGMIAEGKTVIDNIYQIDRGYEKIEKRLQKLGVDIRRVKEK